MKIYVYKVRYAYNIFLFIFLNVTLPRRRGETLRIFIKLEAIAYDSKLLILDIIFHHKKKKIIVRMISTLLITKFH